jgi:hypothetical protein
VKVSTKLKAMLKRNPGFLIITSACQLLNKDDVDAPEDIVPGEFLNSFLKICTSDLLCGRKTIFSLQHSIRQKTINGPRQYGEYCNCVL